MKVNRLAALALLLPLIFGAWKHGVANTGAPVLHNQTITMGEFTRSAQGGAPISNLVVSSGTIDHYVITETDANAGSGYWQSTQNALDASPSYQTISGSPLTVSNGQALTTPVLQHAAYGQFYSSADINGTLATNSVTTCSGVSVVDFSTWASFQTPLHSGQLLRLRGVGTPYTTTATLAAFTSTDPCHSGTQTGQGGAGFYVLTAVQNSGNPIPSQETQVGDVMCGSDGSAIFALVAENDPSARGSIGVLETVQYLANPTSTLPYGNGNVSFVGGSCQGYTQATLGIGATLTTTYLGYAEAPTPTGTGQSANLGYVATPGSCGPPPASNLCADDVSKFTFSVVGYPASGSSNPSNTVTLTIDLGVDSGNIGNTVLNSSGMYSGSGSPYVGAGSTTGLTAERAAANNCTTGGSSICDLELLISDGAVMSSPAIANCCGKAQQFPFFDFGYLPTLGTAGATWSINDSFHIKDACRHGGSVIIAAATDGANSTPVPNPAVTACRSDHGTLANFDYITVGSNATNSCTTTDPASPGASGLTFEGLTGPPDPRDNYTIGAEYGVNFADYCNDFVVSEKDSVSYNIGNNPAVPSTYGLLTSSLGGNFSTLINYGLGSGLYITYTNAQGVNCFNDSVNPGQTPATIFRKHSVCRVYTNNADTPCVSATYSDLEYHFQGMLYNKTVIHPDTVQLGNQCNPINDEFDRWVEFPAGGNTSNNGIYFGNVVYPFMRGMRFKNCFYAGNSASSIYFQGNDGTTRNSTFTNCILLRQQPPVPGSNASNPLLSMTGTSRTIVDGDRLIIGVGCDIGVSPNCTGGAGYVQLGTYTLTAKNTVTNTATQFQIGSSNTATLVNLVNALSVAVNPGDCSAVTPTTISAAIAAYSASVSSSGGFFCARAVNPGGVGSQVGTVIFSSVSPAAPFWIYSIISTDSTGAGGQCNGTGTSWAVFQFCTSENDLLADLPFQWEDGTIVPQGPDLTLGDAMSQDAASCTTPSSVYWCGLTAFSGVLEWDAVQVGNSSEYTQATTSSALTSAGTAITFGTNNYVVGCASPYGSKFTGSISGTTLTVSATISGTVAIGNMVVDANLGTNYGEITGGSAPTWTLSANSGTVGSKTMVGNGCLNAAHGIWTGDSTVNLETQLEAIPDTYWFDPARTDYDICSTYMSKMPSPVNGGPLDPSGTVTGGLVDASGNWLGYSTAPCADMQTSGDPWPHLAPANDNVETFDDLYAFTPKSRRAAVRW